MNLGLKLQGLLDRELFAGNAIEGVHVGAFLNCKILVILKKPLLIDHAIEQFPDGVELFTNRDEHYPVGKGFVDRANKEILIAPFV